MRWIGVERTGENDRTPYGPGGFARGYPNRVDGTETAEDRLAEGQAWPDFVPR